MLRYTLADGTELDDPQDGVPVDDQIAFEDRFGVSFSLASIKEFKYQQWLQPIVEAQEEWEAQAADARGSGEEPPPPLDLSAFGERPEDTYLPTKWVVFFSWRRLRRARPDAVPEDYEEFVRGLHWETVEDDAPAPTDAEERERLEAEALEAGSGLDPTDPAARLTSSPSSSSSPASTTAP